MSALLVLVGAAVGAPCRYLVDQAVARRIDSVFPWGTLAINVSGSFVLGAVLAASSTGSAGWQALLGTGFCGAFTTFSTFAYETTRLTQGGAALLASMNVVSSVAVGLAAAYGGWYLGSAVWG